MTAPSYIALRTDLRGSALYDFNSGWGISGAQVLPYPTDPAQVAAVQVRLNYGILVSATYEEWLTQNPIPVYVPEEIVLTEPMRITPDRHPEFEGEGNTVWISQLTPRTTAAFIIAEIDAENSAPRLIFLVESLSRVAFYNIIVSGVHNVSGPNSIVISDGVDSLVVGYSEALSVVGMEDGQYLTTEQYDNGFIINLLRDDDGWTANFDLSIPDIPDSTDLSDYYTKEEVDSAIGTVASEVQSLGSNVSDLEAAVEAMPVLTLVEPAHPLANIGFGGSSGGDVEVNYDIVASVISGTATGYAVNASFQNPGDGKKAVVLLRMVNAPGGDATISFASYVTGQTSFDAGGGKADLWEAWIVGQGTAGEGDPASVTLVKIASNVG